MWNMLRMCEQMHEKAKTEEDDLSHQRLRHLGLFVFESVEEELRNLPSVGELSPESVFKENFVDEIGLSDTVKTYLRGYTKLLFQLADFDVTERTITLFANYALFYWMSTRETLQILGNEPPGGNK